MSVSETVGQPAGPALRKGMILFFLGVSQLMIILDATIVNVALDNIRVDLGVQTTGDLQWIVTGYALAFGGFLLFVRRQRPWDRFGGLNKRGFLAHLNPRGIEDETEHQSPESIGREGREGHPAGDSSAVRRRREDPDRSGGACAARTVSLSCVAVRGSTRTSITAGRRTSWRPGRSAWRVTLPVRLPPMRSGIFAVRHWHSRRPLLT